MLKQRGSSRGQMNFIRPCHNLSHGGSLRNRRSGRLARPLSCKNPIHCVLKINRKHSRIGLRSFKSFEMIQGLIKTYAKMFFVKIVQISIQGDHIHLLIRANRRSEYQSFFRVLAGQIAQEYLKRKWVVVTDTPKGEGRRRKLWKYRPFTRVVVGWRAYKIVRNYIQLNEKEFLGEIPYKKDRLRGLSSSEWQILWA
jgi:putative transposase